MNYDSLKIDIKTLNNIEFLSKLVDSKHIKDIGVNEGRFYTKNNESKLKKKDLIIDCLNNTINEIDLNLKVITHIPGSSIEKLEKTISTIERLYAESNSKSPNILKKIRRLELQILKIREANSLAFIKKKCPEMYEEIKNSMQMLIDSEHIDVRLEERMKRAPSQTSGGASGSYFLNSLKPEAKKEFFHENFNLKIFDDHQIYEDYTNNLNTSFRSIHPNKKIHKAVIGKPSVQEYLVTYPGFSLGTNFIRERIAYSMQKLLDMDCNIPPTTIASLSHPIFQKQDSIKHKLQSFGLPLTRQKFTELTGNGENLDDFRTKLIEYQNSIIEKEIEGLTEQTKNEIRNFVFFSSEATQSVKKYNELNGYIFSEIRKMREENPQLIKNKAEDIIQEINTCKITPSEILSCQLLIENCQAIAELTTLERERINPKEYEKFIIDLILFNADRHTGNILTRSITREGLLQQLEAYFPVFFAPITHTEFIKLVAELLNENKDCSEVTNQIIKFLNTENNTKITDRMEKIISNLVFSVLNDFDSVFELILIDHGNCLPDPEANDGSTFSSLDFAMHQWGDFNGIDQTLFSGKTKEKILNLNINKVIHGIKKEIDEHTKCFGKQCAIPPSCVDLIHLNLLILKKGVENNLSLGTLNSFFDEDGLVKQVYFKLKNKATSDGINWKLAEKLIDKEIKIAR